MFSYADENDNVNNSESKRCSDSPMENNDRSDDEQNKRGLSGDSGNSMGIKRERNECSKNDETDAENSTSNSGEHLSIPFFFLFSYKINSRFQTKFRMRTILQT